MTAPAFTPTKFKIWYIHQIPGLAWEQEVDNPEIGQAILDGIYQAMLFAEANRQIPATTATQAASST